MNKSKNTAGCFILENGFPDEYYAFTDGEISATVERNGGINTIGCLDIYEQDGKLYPDRGMTPVIFQREGNHCGKRPLYGPAVQFISTSTDADGRPGRNLFHVPDQVELYPFGFKSESSRFRNRTTYDLAIDGQQMLFSFTNEFPSRNELVITIDKDHIYQGPAGTLKNQLAEGGGNQEHPPFEEERIWEQKWDFIGFDSKLNGLVIEGLMRFKYEEKPVTILLAADKKIRFSENSIRYFLTIPWDTADEIRLCLTINGSREEAGSKTKQSLAELKETFVAKIAESEVYSAAATELSANNYPDIEHFSRTAPSFLRAMVLAETDTEACIRAAMHKYGFFIIWDQVWPARGFLLMGDWQTAAKLVRYPLSRLEGGEIKYEILYLVLLIIGIAEDIIAVSGDQRFEKEIYKELKRLFLIYLDRASENGLLPANGACGVDDPAEIGIEGDVWPCCLNSLWYDACRAMENLALRCEDDETAGLANNQGELIRKHYLATFYQPEHGYLYSSVDAETGKGIPIYQNVGTLGMDFAYGEWLLKDRVREIAEFQAKQLYHPAGRSAVPYWDTSHEMWKNVIMYQHIAHEMRTAKSAGLNHEIERMMHVYLGHFHRNKVAIETHNLTGADGDISQRANWQAFGARALYSAIFESLIGIQCHLGGFHYTPGDATGKMAITGFRFRQSTWDITVDGKGAYAEEISVDGQTVSGTLQIPEKYYLDKQHHCLDICRSVNPFDRPTLLSAIAAQITEIESTANQLRFKVKQKAHTTIKVYCPERPTVLINDNERSFDWDANKNLAWIDTLLEPNEEIVVNC